MKKHILLCGLLFLVACTPVKVTRQYYEDYVNPKPSIDYEDTVSTDLPAEFLDDYYTVDSKIVRLVDQIDLMDSQLESSWVDTQKAVHPWVRHMAVLDGELLFISGDDTLGFDPAIREALAERTATPGRFFISSADRVILVHVGAVGHEQLRTTLVEVDLPLLTMEIPGNRTGLFAGERLFGGSMEVPADALAGIVESTSYSGERGAGGKDFYWIRSMASDNLVYIYAN
jgi:hypothetical protein